MLTPYSGQITAGFAPAQTQAQGVLTGIASDPQYAANNNQAISGVQGVLGNQVNGQVNAAPVNASTIAGTDLSQYMNPFQSNVIDASVAQNERAREIAGVSDAQHAAAAGAFGGSRSGVLSAQTNEAYDRNNQTNIAALNSANYNQAQSAAATDAATHNQVGEFNSGQNINAQQSTIGNQIASNTQQLSAAGQLQTANNNALGTATTQAGILGAVGDAQQAQHQTELTNAYNAYTQGQQLTVAQQQLLNQALGLVPNQQTVNSSGTSDTTQKTTPGIGDILSGVGSLAQGAGAARTAFSDMRLKSDIVPLWQDTKGRNWYSYRYNWEPEGTYHEGVMAQEILASDPDAVHVHDSGFFMVDYSKLKGAN